MLHVMIFWQYADQKREKKDYKMEKDKDTP